MGAVLFNFALLHAVLIGGRWWLGLVVVVMVWGGVAVGWYALRLFIGG